MLFPESDHGLSGSQIIELFKYELLFCPRETQADEQFVYGGMCTLLDDDERNPVRRWQRSQLFRFYLGKLAVDLRKVKAARRADLNDAGRFPVAEILADIASVKVALMRLRVAGWMYMCFVSGARHMVGSAFVALREAKLVYYLPAVSLSW